MSNQKHEENKTTKRKCKKLKRILKILKEGYEFKSTDELILFISNHADALEERLLPLRECGFKTTQELVKFMADNASNLQ